MGMCVLSGTADAMIQVMTCAVKCCEIFTATVLMHCHLLYVLTRFKKNLTIFNTANQRTL